MRVEYSRNSRSAMFSAPDTDPIERMYFMLDLAKKFVNCQLEDEKPEKITFEYDASKYVPDASGDLGVFIRDGEVLASSRAVANALGRRHDDVIKSIRTLGCSEDFQLRNFSELIAEVTVGNGAKKKIPVIYMTRDGCTFFMGRCTGEKAAQYIEAYINKFNEMEATLRAQEAPALPSPKEFYTPEEAADMLRFPGYRTLYKKMEQLGLLKHKGRRYMSVQKYAKYVRMQTLRQNDRPVITPAGIEYLRKNT